MLIFSKGYTKLYGSFQDVRKMSFQDIQKRPRSISRTGYPRTGKMVANPGSSQGVLTVGVRLLWYRITLPFRLERPGMKSKYNRTPFFRW